MTVTEPICPECGTKRPDLSAVCPTCGAPPMRADEQRAHEYEVRGEDLEPYITLRYVARLFKILAALMIVALIGEVITGLMARGVVWSVVLQLIVEVTRLLVIAGLMWAGGDVTLLLIDLGHDIRVQRILLGRINARIHRGDSVPSGERRSTPR